jgi:hypothetical protein
MTDADHKAVLSAMICAGVPVRDAVVAMASVKVNKTTLDREEELAIARMNRVTDLRQDILSAKMVRSKRDALLRDLRLIRLDANADAKIDALRHELNSA